MGKKRNETNFLQNTKKLYSIYHILFQLEYFYHFVDILSTVFYTNNQKVKKIAFLFFQIIKK